ncbi:MAG TPA: RimK family alpha-L-glutamate ligase [Novosphingobium sp.]|nr:RimK family alpha-L-glutamate ligase [Novosphingobium sp.]
MRAWIFFHRDLAIEEPEAAEIFRFQETAQRLDIELEILKPQDFELIVGVRRGWDASYRERSLEKPDFIIPRTGSETSYFTLAVLRHFERQGVHMVNGADAIECVADKLHSLQQLASHGIPIPRTILGKFPVDIDLIDRELGFPVVVKTVRGTRGENVMLCDSREKFGELAGLLGGARPGGDLIFQRYIGASHGRDVRLFVVGGKVVATMERRAANGGFRANTSQGGSAVRYDPPAEMRALAIRVAEVLQLDVAGVDILFDEHGFRVCEANSAPGFKSLEAACGIDVPETIFRQALRRVQMPQGLWRRATSFLKPRGGKRQSSSPSPPRANHRRTSAARPSREVWVGQDI